MSSSVARQWLAQVFILRVVALGFGFTCSQVARTDAAIAFRAPLRFETGCIGSTISVAAIDIDGDGANDLAIACDSKLVIKLGDGFGGMREDQQIGLPSQPWSMVTGDFNRDGAPDLACALVSTDQVSVLLNDGTGSFGVPTQYLVGDGPSYIAAGDIDGDDAIDLVTRSFSNALFFLHGDGTGLFGIASSVPTGDAASGTFVLADLDEDNDLDIAATRTSSDIFVLTNDGLGNFAAGGTYAAGTGPSRVVAADLNGDGHLDLAALSASRVLILIGDGGGHFAPPGFQSIASPERLFAADLNEDGRTDLAVASQGRLTLLIQGSTGNLQSGQVIPLEHSYALTGADFDSNGRIDLAVQYSGLAIYLGEARGYLLDAAHSAAGDYPLSVVSADFNSDGHRDAVVSNGPEGALTVLLGIGNGDFTPAAPIVVPGMASGSSLPSVVAAIDFNEDGRPDLAVLEHFTNLTRLFLGNGRGGFVLLPQSLYASGRTPVIADFNADGHIDVALACTIDAVVGTCLSLGNGQGSFSPPQPLIEGVYPLAVGDLNGDSYLDLVSSFSRFVYVLLGDGQGTFVRILGDYEVGGGPINVTIGDLDGDAHIDIAVTSRGASSADPSLISLLFGNGAGRFAVTNLETGRELADSLFLADLDLDGDIELVAATGSDPMIFEATGPRTYGNVQHYSCGDTSGAMVVGDFDDDGRPDLLTSGQFTHSVCFVANRTPLTSFTMACADGLDNDGDSAIDFPADPGCSDPWDGLEADRLSVTFAGDRLQWNRWRSELYFDVVRGSLLGLKSSRGDFSIATLGCAANNAADPYLTDETQPRSGDGFWFLVRPVTSAAVGSYDSGESGQQGLRDAEINSSALACP